MDLDPMINTSVDENTYLDYDNRPIRPMDQDALNEALARLPILVDEDELTRHNDPNTSIRTRRQPVLAYSTRRKNFSGVNINQTVLNVTETPINNKRKLGGFTPMNKIIKQLDAHQDLIQLREENKILEETKATLQLECTLLKKTHETELEALKQEHHHEIEMLLHEHDLQHEQFKATLADKEQLIFQANLELDNLRNDHMMLLLEKETLDKIVVEYQLIKDELTNRLSENEAIIKKLQDEIENMKLAQQQKQTASKSTLTNGRMPIKEMTIDRSRTTPNNTGSVNDQNDANRIKLNKKAVNTRTPMSSTTAYLNKSTSSTSTTKPPVPKSNVRPHVTMDDRKKLIISNKNIDIKTTNAKPKITATK